MTFVMTVPSSTAGETHQIRKAGTAWVCSCNDHLFRSHGDEYACKHLAELALSLALFTVHARKSDSAERILRDVDLSPVPDFADLELPAGP